MNPTKDLDKYLRSETYISNLKPSRMFMWLWKQNSKTLTCPQEPKLYGKIAVITGGNKGIGYETAKGLVQRGAEVIILNRSEEQSKKAIKAITDECEGKMHFVHLNLADIESVINATQELSKILSTRKIDIFIANAATFALEYSESVQGYENGFAINVLGHHVLFKGCVNQSLLETHAKIIVLSGDIYIQDSECTSDYTSKKYAPHAYARSKLGNIWWGKEIYKRYPDLKVNIVHPGVVATHVMGNNFILHFLQKKLLLSPNKGAQATLICATQDVANGAYYVNTKGRVKLHKDDIAENAEKAAALWDLLEQIINKYFITSSEKCVV